MAQLTFGDVEGDAFVGQLDGVTRRSGCGARPRSSARESVVDAERRTDRHLRTSAIHGLRVLPAPVVHAELAALAALAVADLVMAADLDVRLGDRSFGLHSRTAGESPRSEGRPPIPGW